jgi:lipooligosaccharide transport system ATP-binding protein
VLGHRLPRDSKPARAEMGVTPQLDNLDTTLTVEQNLLVFTYLYRVPRAERAAAIDRALQIANLPDRRTAKVDELSGGMRRRLLIARALVHRRACCSWTSRRWASIPQVRQELWALIDRLRSEGTSILMSTHYIEEAQRLADAVTVMAKAARSRSGGRPSSSPSTPVARLSRSTARPGACSRWSRTRAGAAGRPAGPGPP